jgi:hypothetical protein
MSKALKPEELELIGTAVREQYRAAVMNAERTASKLDRWSSLQARANAAPRAVTAQSEGRVAKKSDTGEP